LFRNDEGEHNYSTTASIHRNEIIVLLQQKKIHQYKAPKQETDQTNACKKVGMAFYPAVVEENCRDDSEFTIFPSSYVMLLLLEYIATN